MRTDHPRQYYSEPYDPLEVPILSPEVRRKMLDHGWPGRELNGIVFLAAHANWEMLSDDQKAQFIRDAQIVLREIH